MDDSLQRLRAKDGFAAVERLLTTTKVVRVHKSAGSFQALLCARLAQLPSYRRPLLAITADEAAAQALTRDLRFFLPSGQAGSENDPTAPPRVAHLPWLETTPWADVSPDRRAIVQRMSTLFRLSQGMAAEVLVASAPALARRVVPRAAYADLVDVVQKGEEIDRDALLATLVRGGYTRMPVVEDPGTFAVRG